jgi:hypothetical protein
VGRPGGAHGAPLWGGSLSERRWRLKKESGHEAELPGYFPFLVAEPSGGAAAPRPGGLSRRLSPWSGPRAWREPCFRAEGIEDTQRDRREAHRCPSMDAVTGRATP